VSPAVPAGAEEARASRRLSAGRGFITRLILAVVGHVVHLVDAVPGVRKCSLPANTWARALDRCRPGLDYSVPVQGIWRDLQGQVDRARIHEILVDLFPLYQEARILSFVPILMRRDATEILHLQS
jgi:hypothetical protein